MEDWNRITNVNEEIISLFDEYKVKSQLEPTPEEQEARYWRKAKKVADKNNRSSSDIDSKASSISTPGSDDSFLLSPVSQFRFKHLLHVSNAEFRAKKVKPMLRLDLMISSMPKKKERRRKTKRKHPTRRHWT